MDRRAVLLLGAWLLIGPPITGPAYNDVDADQPVSDWTVLQRFESETDCTAKATEDWHVGVGNPDNMSPAEARIRSQILTAEHAGPNDVGLLAVALFFAACATYNFWLARVTKEGRPVGVQVTLTIQALGAVYYVVQIAVDPAHVTNHVSALIVTGLCAWWYLRALSHLSAPKTPPSAPTVQLQDEWVL